MFQHALGIKKKEAKSLSLKRQKWTSLNDAVTLHYIQMSLAEREEENSTLNSWLAI